MQFDQSRRLATATRQPSSTTNTLPVTTSGNGQAADPSNSGDVRRIRLMFAPAIHATVTYRAVASGSSITPSSYTPARTAGIGQPSAKGRTVINESTGVANAAAP